MGVRGLLVAAGGVVMATLMVLVIVLLVDINNLTDQVTGLEGATTSAGNPDVGQLQTSIDAANQGIGAVTLAVESMQNALPHYKITCVSAGAGDVESCAITPPS
jgi:hypothetical protein